jgi:murein DD-endopeptidase MepM/ murein hydrolase activator NlpD
MKPTSLLIIALGTFLLLRAPGWSCESVGHDSSILVGETIGSLPHFRWPVRGKRIVPSCRPHDGASGVNIAVPVGTPIEAAEDGIVTYAGDHLKAFGNLVLVRHSNGYSTTYAHASRLLVERHDRVKRGQVIALSGETGRVWSPQLHFEVRKGSTPVDPLLLLESGGRRETRL